MWLFMLLTVGASLGTWLARPAWASGPGEPFPVGCWIIILVLVVVIIVLLGLLLKEKNKNRRP
jgi:hypothetical protein